VLFDGFQGKINKERYKKLQEISEGTEQLAIENAMYTILLAYYNTLLQKEAVKIARQSLQLSLERHQDAQFQYSPTEKRIRCRIYCLESSNGQ